MSSGQTFSGKQHRAGRLLFGAIVGCVAAWWIFGYFGWQMLRTVYDGHCAFIRPPAPTVAWEAYWDQSSRLFMIAAGTALVGLLCALFAVYWRALSRLTKSLALFAFLNIVLVNAVLLTGFPETKFTDTNLFPVSRFLLMWEADDSWKPMVKAFDYQETHQGPLYQRVFFEGHTKFQYPPATLWVAALLRRLAPIQMYPQPDDRYFLSGIAEVFSWLFMVLLMVFVGRIFALGFRRYAPAFRPPSSTDAFARRLLICVFAVTFIPVVASYSGGQIQTWLNGLFAVMLWSWMVRQEGQAGFLAGLLCLTKPQYGLLLLWGLCRRRWEFVRAGALCVGIGLGLSIVRFGWAQHLDYLNVLRFIAQHGEAFFANQSFNGLLNRWFHNGDSLNFDFGGFPPFHPLVYRGTMVSSVLLVAAALWPVKRRAGGIEDLAVISLSATLASPIAWQHHYGILLPLYAVLLPCLLTRRVAGPLTMPLLGLSYALTSNFFAPFNRFAQATNGLNLLQSHMLFGALAALILWYLVRSDVRAPRRVSG